MTSVVASEHTVATPQWFAEFTKERTVEYDTTLYDFRTVLLKIFGVEDLSTMHSSVPGSDQPGLVTFSNDQATAFHKQFYSSPYLSEFLALYERFIKEVIAPMFKTTGAKIVYQKKPTFRVHLPNNVAVGQKHRDFDYQHPAGEINFWLPFTKAWGNNSLYVETEPDKADFHSITLNYGQVFRFYGNKCWHYNNINDTGVTRVSVDFRVIPESLWDYSCSDRGSSVKSAMKFDIGSYYDVCSCDNKQP